MPKTLEVKQVEAEARQAEYDRLSPEHKLARLETRPGACARERAKILKQVEKRNKVAKKVAK
jgi:hypothetical protein